MEPIDKPLCEDKRMADGKPCGKPAKFKQTWDHPERFPPRYLCGVHAKFIRADLKVRL